MARYNIPSNFDTNSVDEDSFSEPIPQLPAFTPRIQQEMNAINTIKDMPAVPTGEINRQRIQEDQQRQIIIQRIKQNYQKLVQNIFSSYNKKYEQVKPTMIMFVTIHTNSQQMKRYTSNTSMENIRAMLIENKDILSKSKLLDKLYEYNLITLRGLDNELIQLIITLNIHGGKKTKKQKKKTKKQMKRKSRRIH
jgi:hypothetical protein